MKSTQQQQELTPENILQIGLGFWASKALLTAVNMGLFTALAEKGSMSGNDIKEKFDLHDRGLYDFLDALVALGFLRREGLKQTARYGNSPESERFLDRKKPEYIGGILEMCNNRLYPFWGTLDEGLKTGKPQNETKTGGKPIFELIYADPDKLREFVRAMAGIQMGNFIHFAKTFDFSNYKTLCDVGGAGGYLSAHVVLNNEHMRCTTFDLPEIAPVANEVITRLGLKDKISIEMGDFFQDELPRADVITMGNILHDWGTEDKKMLIKKAFDALPAGGSLVVIENIIDDERRENAFGLLMSLNMLIETEEGFDYSAADFDEWAKETGFKETYKIALTGPASAVVAVK